MKKYRTIFVIGTLAIATIVLLTLATCVFIPEIIKTRPTYEERHQAYIDEISKVSISAVLKIEFLGRFDYTQQHYTHKLSRLEILQVEQGIRDIIRNSSKVIWFYPHWKTKEPYLPAEYKGECRVDITNTIPLDKLSDSFSFANDFVCVPPHSVCVGNLKSAARVVLF